MPTFRDAIRGLIPFGEHWTVSEIVDAIGRIHDADLAALRRKGDALVILLDKAMVLDPLPIGVERDCVAAVAAWNAPAPSGVKPDGGKCCYCETEKPEESPCPSSPDGQHCEHWWDGKEKPGCRRYGRCVSLSKTESQSCCGCGAYEPDDEPAQGDKVCGTCGGTGRVAIRYRVNEQGFGTEPCPSCGGANG